MDALEIRVDAPTGMAEALRQLDPQRVYEVFTRFFVEGPAYVKAQLAARATPAIAGKIKIKKDPFKPPHWALVGSTHPLAHIKEGGTARRGAPGFHHANRHFPRVDGPYGLMQTAGLPRHEAFALARAIDRQGGLDPEPYVAPTRQAVAAPLEQMFRSIVTEVVK